MVSGGTRFARSKRSRAAPRVIDVDVDVRPPHKTLYEVLVVPPTTSSRQIRRIARALRRNLPHMSDLDEVCLAEQVLGRRDLRAEYDALLARVRTARLTMPQIGAAIEGSRPDPPFSARFAAKRRASAEAANHGAMIALRVAAAIVALAIGAARCGAGHGYDSDRYKAPQLQLPKYDLPTVDVDRLRRELDKLNAAKLGIPKIEPKTLEPSPAGPARRAPPSLSPSMPRNAGPPALETP